MKYDPQGTRTTGRLPDGGPSVAVPHPTPSHTLTHAAPAPGITVACAEACGARVLGGHKQHTPNGLAPITPKTASILHSHVSPAFRRAAGVHCGQRLGPALCECGSALGTLVVPAKGASGTVTAERLVLPSWLCGRWACAGWHPTSAGGGGVDGVCGGGGGALGMGQGVP